MILPLEQQVTSLELSKKLKELGVKQESLFYFVAYENPLIDFVSEDKVSDDHWILTIESTLLKSCDWKISAFTVAELGEMLPAYTNINGNPVMLELSKYYRPGDAAYAYSAEYWFLDNQHYKLGKGYYDKNEANVRAEMKIFLIENKLI